VANLIGWLLLGVLVLLLGALILGFWIVSTGFARIQNQLREIRTQFDTSIRLQNGLQEQLSDVKVNARYDIAA
jgi:hypothetical protein